jgi:hypothetical protein
MTAARAVNASKDAEMEEMVQYLRGAASRRVKAAAAAAACLFPR